MDARWLSVLVSGCVRMTGPALPAADAPAVERRSAYRWNRIAAVVPSAHRRRTPRILLGDGRYAQPNELAAVDSGSDTERARARWIADTRAADRWDNAALAAFGAGGAGSIIELATLHRDRGAIFSLTAIATVAAVVFSFCEGARATRRANSERETILLEYNSGLAQRLELCTRGLELLDCASAPLMETPGF